jgi:hypothetical protein
VVGGAPTTFLMGKTPGFPRSLCHYFGWRATYAVAASRFSFDEVPSSRRWCLIMAKA